METPRPADSDRDDEQHTPRRRPFTQRTFGSLVDQRIKAAEAEGAFQDLPGAGKPLQLEDDSLVPEEDRVAYRVLKNAGFAPPWIELQKTIREEQDKLEIWLARANERWVHARTAEQTRLRSEYESKIVELNRLILHYNLIVPPAVGQLSLLRVKEELARLGVR